MKNKFNSILLITFALITLSLKSLSTKDELLRKAYKNSHLKYVSGAPAGMTGAPGEFDCTICHSGSLIVSDVSLVNDFKLLDVNLQEVLAYIPGQTYSVSIDVNSPALVKGFQTSGRILSNDSQAGVSVGNSSVQLTSSNNKEYLTHVASSTNALPWVYSWTAPTTDVGDIRFYLATNETNSNGANSGDGIRVSQHTYSPASNSSLNDISKSSLLNYSFDPYSKILAIKFSTIETGNLTLDLIDLNGKSIFSKSIEKKTIGINSEEILLPPSIKEGVYVLSIKMNKSLISKKIFLNNI